MSDSLARFTSLVNEIMPASFTADQALLVLPRSSHAGTGIDMWKLEVNKHEFIRLSCLTGVLRLAGQGNVAAFCRLVGDLETFCKAWQIGLLLQLWQNREQHADSLQRFLQTGEITN